MEAMTEECWKKDGGGAVCTAGVRGCGLFVACVKKGGGILRRGALSRGECKLSRRGNFGGSGR